MQEGRVNHQGACWARVAARAGGLALAGLTLVMPAAALAGPTDPDPTLPRAVTTPSGLAVPTAPALTRPGTSVPTPPRLVRAPQRPMLPLDSRHASDPDGLGVRVHDPRLRDTIRAVAEERTAHDTEVEQHNEESRLGIRQTLEDADAQAERNAVAKKAKEGFWYRLFHGK